ncbi:unnamed protein product [Gongylonema pulchrum]|uniref:MOR2-PAG1_N domain-containing protein n=1 Tax=Gongylonema pulchrum TaxID=637853 RepID=A0A183DTG2_9BILA|nr:unnamed protein product [Gongylonema pulchrum]
MLHRMKKSEIWAQFCRFIGYHFLFQASKEELREASAKNLLQSCFEYISMCLKTDDLNFDQKKIAEAWLAVYGVLKNCGLLTQGILAEQAKIVANVILSEFVLINKMEELILSPFDPHMEIGRVIDFWIKRIILKYRPLQHTVLAYLKEQIESGTLFAGDAQQDEIYLCGSSVQFLLLIRGNRKPINEAAANGGSARRNTDLYAICVKLLGERLQRMANKYMESDLFMNVESIFQEL